MKRSGLMIAGLVWPLLGLACGPALQHTSRGAAPGLAKDVVRVKIVDEASDRPARTVSLSVLEMKRTQALPSAPAASDVAAMREAAAAHHADVLVIERLDTRWRRAFYGVGMRYLTQGETTSTLQACTHKGAQLALASAQKAAGKCLAKLKKDRPALTGTAEVSFEVDAFGDVRRAAVTPNGSRDTLVQRCAFDAVFDEGYGAPETFGCRLLLSVGLDG